MWLPMNKTTELSMRSSLLSHLMLVLHLCICTISASGPVDMAAEILAPYFPNGGFKYLDIPFDIVMKHKLNEYSWGVWQLWSIAFKNVIVAIMNHSDNNQDDLFLGMAANDQAWASLPFE